MNSQRWEDLAPKNDLQLNRLKSVEIALGSADSFIPTRRAGPGLSEEEEEISRGPQIFSEFYAKYRAHSNEDSLELQARLQVEKLRAYEKECGQYADQARKALTLLEALEGLHQSVSAQTHSLHTTCETLLQEQTTMAGQLGALEGPVAYFTAVEDIAPQLGLPVASLVLPDGLSEEGSEERATNAKNMDEVALEPKVRPGTDEFDAVVARIDECLKYYADHPQYHDSDLYMMKMGQLQARAFALVKKYVVEQLQALRGRVEEEMKRPSHASVEANLETSPIYTKFKGMAPRLLRCIKLLRSHADQKHDESAIEFLEEVEQSFSQQRLALLQPPFKAYLQRHMPRAGTPRQGANPARVSQDQLVSVVRFGASHLLRVGKMEENIFRFCLHQNHGADDEAKESKELHLGKESAVYGMLLSLNEGFYHLLRPLVIQQTDIDDLCELVGVIREEIFGDNLEEEEGAALAALEASLLKVVEDAQERLILCVQGRMREEVLKYEPTDENLDYPNILEKHEEQKHNSSGPVDMFATWYPPLRSTLLLLSKIYRTVDMSVFEDLAQQAVLVTTRALNAAAEKIKSQQTQLDGDLFLIKHLLVMREQLTPFDIQFLAIEKRLDFTQTASAFYAFLQEPTRMFRLDSSNALLHLAADGLPKVNETTLDAKKELEETLKASCNHFIALAADRLAKPMLDWLNKARGFVDLGPSKGSPSLRLRDQVFAHDERVRAILMETASQILDTLPQLMRSMALYLDNKATQSILFKPVQRKFLDAITFMKDILEANYSPQEFSEFWTQLNTISEQVLKIDLSKTINEYNKVSSKDTSQS